MSSHITFENGRLTAIRTYDAPREAVFDAWIQASKVPLWWGCGDAIGIESEIEPKVGGIFLQKLTLKDAGEYHHHGIITAYDPPALLAYRLHDRFHEEPMMVRVEFTESDGRTTVRLIQDNLKTMYSDIVMAGWAEGFEKLHHFLAETQSTKGVAEPTNHP